MTEMKFTVDTHLFRELGEFLVGRDSTALIELVKNSYDADATDVTVHGEYLDNPARARITISDNGSGMTPDQFAAGFLCIASRLKDAGARKSPHFKRRYTGAKGIGRLAAHKLARSLRVESVTHDSSGKKGATSFVATIDWDKVESVRTLEEIDEAGAIEFHEDVTCGNATSGTRIELQRLRRTWTSGERTRFYSEVNGFIAPEHLIELPSGVLARPLLLHKAQVFDAVPSDPGVKIQLSGDLEAGEDYWQVLAQTASWVIELEARPKSRVVEIRIGPTKRGIQEFPGAQSRRFSMPHPSPELGPFFQSRVLIREGGSVSGPGERAWRRHASGIRVYIEGFRIPPYGDPHDDWLLIDSDYSQRQRSLPVLSEYEFAGKPGDSNEGLVVLRNDSYFGAVFLTVSGASTLKMLINREGFIPDSGYENLVKIMRVGVALSNRVRAAASAPQRQQRREQRKRPSTARGDLFDTVDRAGSSAKVAADLAQSAEKLAREGDIGGARKRIHEASEVIQEGMQRLMTEGALIRILASVGTQMTAFVHEMNTLLASTSALETMLAKLRTEDELSGKVRTMLGKVHAAAGNLRRSVERHASYLVDVTSADSRRRRSRLRVSERFDAACRLVEQPAARLGIHIENKIPSELKTPPMFPAELTVIFSNLLSNAVKASGRGGRIRATAGCSDNGRLKFTVENTGTAVDPRLSEKWFKPFESTTVDADPVLGQGMGMGLPITRNMLEEYGATISFCRPTADFATAIEIVFPEG